MTYSLKAWTNPQDENDKRLYVKGTARDSVYLKQAKDGRLVWSSTAQSTPHAKQTGNHYQKVRKDGEAAAEVCAAFDLELGGNDWDRACQIASQGLEVDPE